MSAGGHKPQLGVEFLNVLVDIRDKWFGSSHKLKKETAVHVTFKWTPRVANRPIVRFERGGNATSF